MLEDSSVKSTWTYHLTASPCYTANTNKHNYTISTNKQLINAVTQCKQVDIAHVYWRMQYDTFEVFTCTADLLFFFID